VAPPSTNWIVLKSTLARHPAALDWAKAPVKLFVATSQPVPERIGCVPHKAVRLLLRSVFLVPMPRRFRDNAAQLGTVYSSSLFLFLGPKHGAEILAVVFSVTWAFQPAVSCKLPFFPLLFFLALPPCDFVYFYPSRALLAGHGTQNPRYCSL
jgi:hypothetical protein